MTVAPATRSDLDLKKFGRKLDEEERRLLDEIRNLAVQNDSGDTSDAPGERGDGEQVGSDQATDLLFREQDEAIVASLREQVGLVEASRRKMEQGTYGICDRCQEVIPVARLEVMPWALYCIRCASEVAI